MKITKTEFIVYGQDNISHMITTDKKCAIAIAQQIGGKIHKRCTTVEELEPMDKDYTVWGQRLAHYKAHRVDNIRRSLVQVGATK